MQDIKPHIHNIYGRQVEVSYTNGVWNAKTLGEGPHPCAGFSGGRFTSLEEFIAEVKKNHAYSNAFHSGVDRQEAKRIANNI